MRTLQTLTLFLIIAGFPAALPGGGGEDAGAIPCPPEYAAGENTTDCAGSDAPPTPEAVEAYRQKLEERLLDKYTNHPRYASSVGRVSVVLSRELQQSWDGGLIRAEFDQLVYDVWGNRMPELEQEYYVVTFGSGGVKQVRADPSVRVGLDMEKTYSERAPITADPFRNVPPAEAFTTPKTASMPAWWRPEFPEID